MKIEDYTALNSIDSSCYMPMDVAGDAKIIKADKIAPNIANNLTTTAEGYVLDATQGKALNDLIDDNADDISAMDGVVHSPAFYKAQPWTLHDSRDDNSTDMTFPTTANEVMVVAYDNTLLEYFCSFFVPSMITEDCYLFLGGYMQQQTTSKLYTAQVRVQLLYSTNKVSSISGYLRNGTNSSTYVTINSSSDWSTEIWYR